MAKTKTKRPDLRGIRHARKMTLQQAAERCGCDTATLSRIERGAMPTIATATAIRRVFGIGVEEWAE